MSKPKTSGSEKDGTRVCSRCGLAVVESDLEQYPYLCLRCDENPFAIEAIEAYR